MKVAESTVEVIQSGESEKIAMGFDENSLRHLMSVLTDLYSDAILASIREYLTNAFDSHVEANQTKPIQVSLPTSFRKSFVVKDFGIGLSIEDLQEIYSKYGASTKRDSNDVVGMLGLGCKAGLAYTNQFFVTGVRYGKKVVGLVTRDADGSSSIEVLSHEASDEPDGVTIEIPVQNTYDFNDRVHKFLYYWKPGLVEIDGSTYKTIFDEEDALWIDDNTVIVQADRYGVEHGGRDVLVMGNVPYPMNRPPSVTLDYGYRIIHFADIGSVDFTPSREELQYTPRTNTYMDKYSEYIGDAIQAKMEELIEDAETLQEVTSVVSPFGVSCEWRGITIPRHNVTDDDANGEVYNVVRGRAERSGNVLTVRNLGSPGANTPVVIYGYKPNKFGIGNYRRVSEYINSTGGTVPSSRVTAIVYEGDDYPEGFEEFTTVSWEKVKTWARKQGKTGKAAVSRVDVYRIWDDANSKWVDDEPDDNEKYVIYTDAKDAYSWMNYDVKAICKLILPDYIPVCENANRHDKFIRNNPGSIKFSNAMLNDYIEKNLGDAENIYIHAGQKYQHLNADDFDDPEVQDFLRLVNDGEGVDMPAVKCYNELKRLRGHYSHSVNPPTDWNVLEDKYGVVITNGYHAGQNAEAQVEAINAIYAYRKENNNG